MTDALAMLTAEDWSLLQAHATSISYKNGETLLEEGRRRRALFVVREGSVRVEQIHDGHPITLAQLGPGEIFGEMGFVENTTASASIVAEDLVVVDVIDEAALQSLLASVPGLAIRFYHSLAIALARRLRATSGRLAQLEGSEAAQINRFHLPRTGNASARQIPEALNAGLEPFAQTMLALDIGLRDRNVPADAAQMQLRAACDEVLAHLERSTASLPLMEMGWDDLLAFRDPSKLEAGVGDHVFRSTFPFLMLSSTMARCYAKPRGFHDDHETMAMIYRNEPEGDGHLGPLVDRWFLERPLCRARRSGRDRMRDVLTTVAESWPSGETVRVTSMASGTAAELFDLFRTGGKAQVVATCVDLDQEALLANARQAARSNLGDRMTFLKGNAIPGDDGATLARAQHVIYSHGLWEYLRDDEAVAFLDWVFVHLVEGGTVIVTNLETSNGDRALMEHLLDWKVSHRSVDEVRELFARSRFHTRLTELSLEVRDGQIFARCSTDTPLRYNDGGLQ